MSDPKKPPQENPGQGIGPSGTPPGQGGTPPGQVNKPPKPEEQPPATTKPVLPTEPKR